MSRKILLTGCYNYKYFSVLQENKVGSITKWFYPNKFPECGGESFDVILIIHDQVSESTGIQLDFVSKVCRKMHDQVLENTMAQLGFVSEACINSDTEPVIVFATSSKQLYSEYKISELQIVKYLIKNTISIEENIRRIMKLVSKQDKKPVPNIGDNYYLQKMNIIKAADKRKQRFLSIVDKLNIIITKADNSRTSCIELDIKEYNMEEDIIGIVDCLVYNDYECSIKNGILCVSWHGDSCIPEQNDSYNGIDFDDCDLISGIDKAEQRFEYLVGKIDKDIRQADNTKTSKVKYTIKDNNMTWDIDRIVACFKGYDYSCKIFDGKLIIFW